MDRNGQPIEFVSVECQSYVIKKWIGCSLKMSVPQINSQNFKLDEDDFIAFFNKNFWKIFKSKPLNFQVPIDFQKKNQFLKEIFSKIQNRAYTPDLPLLEIIENKGYGVARVIPVFTLQDYCVYYYCVKKLEIILAGNRTPNTFGGWSMGGVSRKRENLEIDLQLQNYGRYSFNPNAWIKEFGDFNAKLYSQLDTGLYTHAIQFDLSNFYDSIRLDVLERWIREDAPSEASQVISTLFYFLNFWNRANNDFNPQMVGLPSDLLADCSRLLSNYYLRKYDEFARDLANRAGAEYFRYADDQFMLLQDESEIENIMFQLTLKLNKYGLRVNQRKVNLWDIKDLEEHRFRRFFEIQKNNPGLTDSQVVEMFVSDFLGLSNLELKAGWNNGYPLLNWLVFKDLSHIDEMSLRLLLSHFSQDEFIVRLTADKLASVARHHKILGIENEFLEKVSCLVKSSSHNVFLIEIVDFSRKYKSKKLEVEALEQIAKLWKLSSEVLAR